jgi:hypothetical protein
VDGRKEERVKHDTLVKAAAAWLKRNHRVVGTELQTNASETPDAIGWTGWGRCTVVEAKTSRDDFFANANKPHERAGNGVGHERWFLTPPALVDKSEVPEGWGLLEYTPSGHSRGYYIKRVAAAPDREPSKAALVAERKMLVSIAGRSLEAASRVKHVALGAEQDNEPRIAQLLARAGTKMAEAVQALPGMSECHDTAVMEAWAGMVNAQRRALELYGADELELAEWDGGVYGEWFRMLEIANAKIDSLARQHEEDTETAGLLADVCDALWGDDQRAETHGYDDAIERAKALYRFVERVARWRARRREHDVDTGRAPRQYGDLEEWDAIEAAARQALGMDE